MKTLTTFLFTATALLSHAEPMTDFSTKLYFQDAVGNKDTITVGYSNRARADALNKNLGEINVFYENIDTTFFIGISDVKENYGDRIATYRTKVKYADSRGAEYSRVLALDIICKNFPIKISWDKEVFQDSMRSKSFLTTEPGGWFDASRTPVWISETDSMILYDYNKNNDKDYFKWYLYGERNLSYYTTVIQDELQRIGKLYLGFLKHNSWLLTLKTNDITDENLHIYPNPCKEFINIQSDKEKAITGIELYNLQGRLAKFDNKNIETIN